MADATSSTDWLDDAPRSPFGHRVMFVCLILLAWGMFAPAALLPVIREYGELLVEEQKLKDHVHQLQLESDHRTELAEAFIKDSLINERLAVLDLGYKKPAEEVLPVLPADYAPAPIAKVSEHTLRSALLLPDEMPLWAVTAETWAQDHGLIDLFLDPALRPVFLMMSGGLLVAAFVIFAPTRRRDRKVITQSATLPHPA